MCGVGLCVACPAPEVDGVGERVGGEQHQRLGDGVRWAALLLQWRGWVSVAQGCGAVHKQGKLGECKVPDG